jgi:hypothetical protein
MFYTGMGRRSHALLIASLTASACGDDDAELRVVLKAEETITDGISAGDDVEQISDGWTVAFQKYIAVIGDIEVASSTNSSKRYEASEAFALDLTQVSAAGTPLWSIGGMPAGDYEFGYHLGTASQENARRDQSVSKADFEEMVDLDWTYLIEGTLTQAGGQSCPPADLADAGSGTPNGSMNGRGEPCYDLDELSFRIGVAVETAYANCEVDEMPGFNVPAGGTKTVAVTIHGDHLFFNGFPEGDEGGIKRRAQWLADSDLNLDGEVTIEELAAIAPADLAELDDGYQFGGSREELNTMLDYARAQLKTQGHFQGEGPCEVDGEEHSH